MKWRARVRLHLFDGRPYYQQVTVTADDELSARRKALRFVGMPYGTPNKIVSIKVVP